jgi:hypothetical protein
VLGVGDRPESVAVLNEAVFLETFQRGADASLWRVGGINDLSLAKRSAGVLENEAIDRTLGCVRSEVGKRWPVLVDNTELVLRYGCRRF